ncbi:trypsin-like serine peptidase [Streptomyces sp. NPDC057638]|uniref:trypsin-like serine peptidase n=1 Tax=Streptomyces sp. NPDC057638 TaxID=3346190 RepID=UPI0036C6AA68
MRPKRAIRRTACLAAALALATTGCEAPGDNTAPPTASASSSGSGQERPSVLEEVKKRLKEHGIDLDEWRDGEWKTWDKEKWLREARDFINPIIEGLWNPERMREAEAAPVPGLERAAPGEKGVTDPAPARIPARAVRPPYRASAPEAGKVFFDGPNGPMVCSGTVVRDPARPGRSNLVWTAGHCVHKGKEGGWYRNIAFVPSYNDRADSHQDAAQEEVAPLGVWWADWAQTSPRWIGEGARTGGAGAPFDYAVIRVAPAKGAGGRSLEETVGSALPVEFDAPGMSGVGALTATGYPASAPYDGERMFQCSGRPGRLSVDEDDPTMYRIGCTMTGGASGGGWVGRGRDGAPALISNTSIGPASAGWLAGPRLDAEAREVYTDASEGLPRD